MTFDNLTFSNFCLTDIDVGVDRLNDSKSIILIISGITATLESYTLRGSVRNCFPIRLEEKFPSHASQPCYTKGVAMRPYDAGTKRL